MTNNSHAGTRTRVDWVKTCYPNHLDCMGKCLSSRNRTSAPQIPTTNDQLLYSLMLYQLSYAKKIPGMGFEPMKHNAHDLKSRPVDQTREPWFVYNERYFSFRIT